jgi:hypothetical protein
LFAQCLRTGEEGGILKLEDASTGVHVFGVLYQSCGRCLPHVGPHHAWHPSVLKCDLAASDVLHQEDS